MSVVEHQRAASVRDVGYVGGLDGLRAIAVAAVVVYHFSRRALPAGFLGVDVFFVVSGFLIARLVVREVARTGEVSLGNFWARRARRLLPALAVVTLAVLFATALFFTKTDLFGIRAQALGTLFYSANWVLIAQHGSYFASVGRSSPFLHMWSLAVEEQFYVVLPLVCFAARRWIVRFPWRAAAVAVAGAIASSVWMSMLVEPLHDPSRAYFGTDSHAMGLLVGVALGIIGGTSHAWERVEPRLRSKGATVVAAIALIAIVATMRFATDTSYRLYRFGFFGFSIACAIVIAVLVAAPASPLSWLLSRRWIVAIGLRSYALYLWHWPVGVFVEPHPGFNGLRLFVVRCLWSIVLAELTYYFVERPFRVGGVARRTGSRGAVVLYAVVAVLSVALVFSVDAPGAARPSNLASQKSCNAPSTTHVDLFGDSTALVFGLAGCADARALQLSVGGDARLGCGLTITDQIVNGRVNTLRPECYTWKPRWQAILREDTNAHIAVMEGAWDVLDHKTPAGIVRFGTQQWTALVTSSVRDALETLTTSGRPVSLFEVPCYGSGDPNAPIPERGDKARIDAVNAIYEQMAREMPLVRIVHWRDLVCPNGRRRETLNGTRLWEADDVHLTDAGAVEVWKWWLPQLRAGR